VNLEMTAVPLNKRNWTSWANICFSRRAISRYWFHQRGSSTPLGSYDTSEGLL